MSALATAAPAWRPLDARRRAWGWNNRLLVEVTTGSPALNCQCWRWRVALIGGDAGVERTREAAFRAAEFALGLAEQPVSSPFPSSQPKEIASPKAPNP